MKNISIKCLCSSEAGLVELEDGYVCSSKDCFHSSKENRFRKIDGIPVLISEIVCDTVCDPGRINSYVKRPLKKYSWLKKIIVGQSKTTKGNCREFFTRIKEMSQNPKVLVVGSGETGSGTDLLWKDPSIEIHGVDIYASNTVDIVCDAHYLPLTDNQYDGVWIQAVLEHVVEPNKVVNEITRVLKSDGIVYSETPFMQQVHEGAYDFTRYTVLGHRFLFRDFSLIRMGGNKGPEVVLAWAIRYFVWSVTRSRKLGRIAGLFSGVLLRPFGGLVSTGSMYDASSGVYFMGYKNSKNKLSHKELISLYKGQF